MLAVFINKALQSDPLMISDFSRLSTVICNKLKSQTNPGCNKERRVNVGMAEQNGDPSSNNEPFPDHQSTVYRQDGHGENHRSNFVINPANVVHLTNYYNYGGYVSTWPTWPMWASQFSGHNLAFANTLPAAQQQLHQNRYRQRSAHRTANNGERNALAGLRVWERMSTQHNSLGFIFTVMSYNILAQDLIDRHLNLYASHDKKSLDWKIRWKNLLAEISQLKPDILCLQEVQKSHLNSYFSNLEKLGYKGVFKKRTGGHPDGCAVYYKSNKIKLVEQAVTVEYRQPQVSILDRDNIGIIAKFAPVDNSQMEFVVATTHLLYNPKRNDVRLAQMQLLLTEIDRIAFISRYKYLPVILTGDLNVPPDSAVYQFITKGKLKYHKLSERSLESGVTGPTTGKQFLPKFLRITDQCQHADLLSDREKNVRVSRSDELKCIELTHSDRKRPGDKELVDKDDANLFSSGTLRHGFSFQSVYSHNLNGDREATTFHREWISVDYIFYSQRDSNVNELLLLERYRLPTEKELGNTTIPNEHLGSDHLSLSAKFMLKM